VYAVLIGIATSGFGILPGFFAGYVCACIKKVILLGDELPIISFFTEHIRFSFQAPITAIRPIKPTIPHFSRYLFICSKNN
ncbi:hypothetical protein ACT4UT_25555, partial [Bacillus sp. B-TM1]